MKPLYMTIYTAAMAAVAAGLKGVTPYDPKGEKQAGLKPVHMVD